MAAENNSMPVSGYERNYMGDDWNDSSKVRLSNNCYSYALGYPQNPLTLKNWKQWGGNWAMQPGAISNNRYIYLSDVPRGISSDMSKLRRSMREVYAEEEVSKNTYKIALAYDYELNDYHFYVQNADGYWSHKRGSEKVTRYDDNGTLISDPRDAKVGNYKVVKFYEIESL